MSLASAMSSGFERRSKTTRKREFLVQMQRVVPWAELVALIEPYAPKPSAKGGRPPPFAVPTLLRIDCLQQWFGLSDPAVEEALYDMPLLREFVGLDLGVDVIPDESTILRFRHLLEQHELPRQIFERVNALLSERGLMLKSGTVVDATLIAAPSSTKNKSGARDPEMHQTKKGNQWHFGMTSPPQAGAGRGVTAVLIAAKDAAQPHKAHAGVDADSGLVHSLVTTAANVHDVTQAHALLHGAETDAYTDSGYRGVDKRAQVQAQHPQVRWHVAMMPSQRRRLDSGTLLSAVTAALETVKARIRAKGEHPFRVIKCQFGHRKTRYRGLSKNTAQLHSLFALANLWMVRHRLLAMGAWG